MPGQTSRRQSASMAQSIESWSSWLRDRHGMVAVGLAGVGLVAAGAGPVILSVAPCAVLCVLGGRLIGRGSAARSPNTKDHPPM